MCNLKRNGAEHAVLLVSDSFYKKFDVGLGCICPVYAVGGIQVRIQCRAAYRKCGWGVK